MCILLKALLILLIIPFNVLCADFIGFMIADLIPFHTEVAVDLILLKALDTVLLIPLTTLDTVDFILFL